jgi:acetolactate synthase I/II/III large subunit
MRAADFIVSSLKAHGVKRVYCVPGESYLALLDALHDSDISIIVCRHEGGAGFMACAEAKLTGKPSVCLVSRGPGATNVSIAAHVAEQDALPVIFMIGQVARDEFDRGVFQEIDYRQFFGSIAKGVYQIDRGSRLPDMMPRVFRLAAEGTPGPVMLSLPEDMLHDTVSDVAPSVFSLPKPSHNHQDALRIQDLLTRAERPVLVAGAGLRGKLAAEALARFSSAQRIPVATTWKNQDVFDNRSPLYAGHLGFGVPAEYRQLLGEADLILAMGTRLGDVASLQFTFPEAPEPRQTLVHIYTDGGPVGKNFNTDIGLVAEPTALLSELATNAHVVSSGREAWISKINGFVKSMQAFTPRNPTDGVDFGEVIMALAGAAPEDTVITTDAGNMSTWVHRHWQMTPKNILLGAIAGAMGVGVPFAISASLILPGRTVICIVGDGGVLMTGNELATARAFGATPKIVISDNGIYGTIRTHQEREYPGRVSGTRLVNPDFVQWAESFGARSFHVGKNDDIVKIVQEFLDCKELAVLHVQSSIQSLSAFGQINGL